MIARIKAEGLMGLPDFETQLGRLNLLIGPNGTGKSARLTAVMLATLGYVPGPKGAKKNQDIMNRYGPSGKIVVSIELSDKTYLTRRWCRDEKGSVSQGFMVDRRKKTEAEYLAAMVGLKVYDLQAFLKLSEQKKIDDIFTLFPPGGDVADIDSKIDTLKAKQNTTTKKIESLDLTVERLKTSRAQLQLPAGTLAETMNQIEETEAQLVAARQSLQNALVALAKEEGKDEAKKEAAQERPQIEAAVRTQVENELYTKQQEAIQTAKEGGGLSVSMPLPCHPPVSPN